MVGVLGTKIRDMDLDTILDDVQEGRESDNISGNAMDILLSLKDGLSNVLKKIAEMENKQMTLENKIDAMKNPISGKVTGGTQSKKALDEHGDDVTNEFLNASADNKIDVDTDVNSVVVSSDTTEKVVKNFRRVSVDTTYTKFLSYYF